MSSSKGVIRFSVSLPPSLVKDFDETWQSIGYSNRSKAAHDAFRTFISECKWSREETDEIVGTITILYYLNKPGLLNEIIRVQHDFERVVSSSMHIHMTDNRCLEIVAVRGKASKIRELSRELMKKKGVKELKLTVIAL